LKKIGLTTSVPVEVLIAKGYTPIDLNNIFITDADYFKYIDIAEKDGFPKNLCAWIKGIYGVCVLNDIKEIVGVVEGDCSNTRALIEVLELKGIKVYPFSFPHSHELKDVETCILRFIKDVDVTLKEVEEVRKDLNYVRRLAKKIDELTYVDGKATGFENHLLQVSTSDFCGDIKAFEVTLEKAVRDISLRQSKKPRIRLGYIGVPPMTADIYSFVEGFDAGFVYNEVQREFSFPRVEQAKTIFEQYYDYTYPYNIEFRLDEIKRQISIRNIDAIIHYTQAFCYRAIEDIVLRERLSVPILNIEGDKLNNLDARTKLRLEAFLDMVSDEKAT
jgi:benzoyl-CoA reductase/2-hydroxyglutaryl-CoA dehydratase subunit BcrC/BadD/HgdB